MQSTKGTKSVFKANPERQALKQLQYENYLRGVKIEQALVMPFPDGVYKTYTADFVHHDLSSHPSKTTPKSDSVFEHTRELVDQMEETQLNIIDATVNEMLAPGNIGLNAFEVHSGMPVQVSNSNGTLANLTHRYKIGGDPTAGPGLENLYGWGEKQEENLEVYVTPQKIIGHHRFLIGTTKSLSRDYNISRANDAFIASQIEPKWKFEKREPIQQTFKVFPAKINVPYEIPCLMNLNKYAFL